MLHIRYEKSPDVSNEALNDLFRHAWDTHTDRDFVPVLQHSLGWICAFDGVSLIGFVNLAWDGGVHAFLLDTTVHTDYQRLGIGAQLVRYALDLARIKSIEWVHVDYEPHLHDFYLKCGFQPTLAGLWNAKIDF